MQLRDFRNDRKPQPRPRATRIAAAKEPSQHLLPRATGMPIPAVGYFEKFGSCGNSAANGDTATGRRMGNGVVDQVPERLEQQPAHALYGALLGIRAMSIPAPSCGNPVGDARFDYVGQLNRTEFPAQIGRFVRTGPAPAVVVSCGLAAG